MATKKAPKVISTVRRDREKVPVKALVSSEFDPPKQVNTKRSLPTSAVNRARASRKAAVKPLAKKKVVDPSTLDPAIVRENPVIWAKDADKPLIERLNPKLLEQLRTRKVTNRAAAEALGVSETYLCRTLAELGAEKVKGATSEHREQRSTLAKTRTQVREQLAKRVNRNEMTIEKAAKAANCSVRTMFRYCAKYLKP